MSLIESIRMAIRAPVEPRPEVFVSHMLKEGQTFHLKGEAVDWWFVGELARLRLRLEFSGLEEMVTVTDLDAAMWGEDPAERARAREVMARLVRAQNHGDWESAPL